MTYLERFSPRRTRLAEPDEAIPAGHDVRDGSIYVYDDRIVLAVQVALATGRPLLLYGPPGSGKSSLAAFVARTMKWNYYEQVVTSRTRAQDLKWCFDAVRRLGDATAKRLHDEVEAYIDPGILWWAFDPESARDRGLQQRPDHVVEAKPPGVLRGWDHPCAVLLDEIDKADPDVPNDLLVTLGSQQFRVTESGTEVKAARVPLVFITSNDERELPRAFIRRCVVHVLDPPDKARLVEIAKNHFPDFKEQERLFEMIAGKVTELRNHGRPNHQGGPSTPEYLDAVRACLDFGVKPGETEEWKAIESAVFIKRGR